MAIASSRPLHLFPSKPLTLHEVLRRYGYSVNLVLSGDHTNFYGLKDAYGEVDRYFDGTHQRERYINDDFLLVDYVDKLPEFEGGRPVAFQFHLMSSHGLGLRHDSINSFQPVVNYYRWPAVNGLRAPSAEDVSKAVNYYDNGVLQFDQVVARLLSALETKGYLNDAVVVIVGDHGEMLGEKGLFGHQRRVDEGVLRIPLIVQRWGYQGDNFGEWPLASQIDVAPSILAELGIEPPSVWHGARLQLEPVPRILHFQQSQQVGLYGVENDRRVMKYWKDLSSGKEFVYNVQHDSGELSNMVGSVDAARLTIWRDEVMKSAVSKSDINMSD